MLSKIMRHLEALVGFDTRNPPRDLGTGGIFDYLRAQLPDFRITVTDHGAGALSLLPDLLRQLQWRPERMRAALEPSMYATDLAIDLAK